jgi:hypothetical protein
MSRQSKKDRVEDPIIAACDQAAKARRIALGLERPKPTKLDLLLSPHARWDDEP